MITVAALYVDPRGPYPSMPGVECWDEQRDARNYAGPHPVVAHPPCGRWCRLAKFVESRHGYRVGDDAGCFASALSAVRRWGGVLEHPAWSLAWGAHNLLEPRHGRSRLPARAWARTFDGEWVCELAQSAYDHECSKLTWLLLSGATPPAGTNWSRPRGKRVIGPMTRRADGSVFRRNADRINDDRAIHSPPAFAEFLVELARRCRSASNVMSLADPPRDKGGK